MRPPSKTRSTFALSFPLQHPITFVFQTSCAATRCSNHAAAHASCTASAPRPPPVQHEHIVVAHVDGLEFVVAFARKRKRAVRDAQVAGGSPPTHGQLALDKRLCSSHSRRCTALPIPLLLFCGTLPGYITCMSASPSFPLNFFRLFTFHQLLSLSLVDCCDSGVHRDSAHDGAARDLGLSLGLGRAPRLSR